VLLAIGFFGGLLVGRHTASDQTVAAPGSFPTPGGGPPAGSMAGFTTGTVSRVDGDTLYLETSDGDTVKVVTDGDTQIQVSEDAKLGDLPTGSTVVVQGTSNDEGVVEATRISEGDLGPGGPATAAGSG
jgi:hypothetical protein